MVQRSHKKRLRRAYRKAQNRPQQLRIKPPAADRMVSHAPELPNFPPLASQPIPSDSRRFAYRPGLLLTFLRLGMMGIALAALSGTLLTVLRPSLRGSSAALVQPSLMTTSRSGTDQITAALARGKRLTKVEQQIRQLTAARPGLVPSIFFLSMDSDAYVDIGGSQPFPAASTIKTPVLIAFFQDVDAGKIKLDEQLVMRQDLIAGEAGSMQYQKPGTKFSALETAKLMISISDNTATNMLIDRLGGAKALNLRFKSWGLESTAIHNWLPDLKGTNTTSAKDQATMMYLIGRGDLVSVRSRDKLLEIMRSTVTNTLLPAGLGQGAEIAHKTGDIGTVIGDAGLIDAPNGQRYVAAIMVKRPFNDVRARELVQQISQLMYRNLSQPTPRGSANSN